MFHWFPGSDKWLITIYIIIIALKATNTPLINNFALSSKLFKKTSSTLSQHMVLV